jgi:hypothetical protein
MLVQPYPIRIGMVDKAGRMNPQGIHQAVNFYFTFLIIYRLAKRATNKRNKRDED